MTTPDPRPEITSVVNVFLDRVFAEGSTFGVGARSRPRRQTGTLDDRDIEAAIGRHVRAPRHQAAWDALGTSHLVLLEGPRGLGKRASAITLLRERTSGPLTVLSPASTTQELAEHPYQAGHGYLVVDQDADNPAHPNFAWHTVRDRVHAARAFLVVTRREPVGDDVEMVTSVRWEPPPVAEVVRVHLPEAGADAERLAAALPADCTMTEVAKAAARVAAGEPVETVVRHLRSAAEVVRAWFEAGPSPRALREVTALAFSTDAGAEELASRTEALTEHLPGDGPAADELVVTRPAGGRAFTDPGYRDLVLAELSARLPKYAWDAVAAWLTELVRAGADLSVAFGLAGLARADRALVEDTFLEPWSAGRLGWNGQTTAAFTVWSMCLTEDSAPAALRTVRGWVRGGPAQRQTAALALSGELGVRFPEEAVRELRAMLSVEPRASGCADAVGTLFGSLQSEGDDGTVVLAPLAILLDDAGPAGAGTASGDAVRQAALSALTARNRTDGEPALSSFLRDRPDRSGLVGQLVEPLLTDTELSGRTLAAMGDALADLKADDIRSVMAEVGQRARPAAPAPAGAVPPATPVQPVQPAPPVRPDRPDPPERSYPVIATHQVEGRGRFGVRRLPPRGPREVFVFCVDGVPLPDPGRWRRSRRLARASHVLVLDVTGRRAVRVGIPLAGTAPEPFLAVLRFACTVRDPVLVAGEQVTDAVARFRDHLGAHRRLRGLARGHGPHDLGAVRRNVTAWVWAYLDVHPITWPGLTVELTAVDVLPPPTPHQKDDDAH